MSILYINTGSSPNKGNGDTLRLAFWKINQNTQLLYSQLASKDVVGEVLSNPTFNRGIVVSYNTVTQYASFRVNVASTSTFGGVQIGSGIAVDGNGLISAFDGNYNNLRNIPQALGTNDSPTFNNLHVNGNLDIAGETTIINSTVITTEDLTFTLANSAASAGVSNGAGIIVNGPTPPAKLTYNSDTDAWNMNKRLDVGDLYSNGTLVVTSSSLGDFSFTANVLATTGADEDMVLTPGGAGKLTLNKIDTLKAAGTIYQGTAYDDVEYSDTSIRVDADTDSFAQMIMKNHNSGTNASTDLVIMNDQGDEFNNFIDLGINSSNYSSPAYSVTNAGDGYLFTNGGGLAIGTQTPGKSLTFHAGGTEISSAGGTLDNTGWHFNRSVDIAYQEAGQLAFVVKNQANSAGGTSEFRAENDTSAFLRMGINSSQHSDGNILPNETFIRSSGLGDTIHIGGQSTINFYANTDTGYSGTATLQLSHHDQSAIFAGNLLPNSTNIQNVGSQTNQWNALYLSSTGAVYFEGNKLSVDSSNRLNINDADITAYTRFSGSEIFTDNVLSNTLKIRNNGAVLTTSIELPSDSNLINVKGNLMPTDTNAYDIGGPFGQRWRGIYVEDDGINFGDGSTLLTGYVYDILPNEDNLYNLGSAEYQWANLYVSSATIFIGGKALTIDPDNNITIDGTVYGGSAGNGYTGSNGINGYTGSAGVDGIGYTGSAGVDGIGYTGYVGSQGEVGYTGSQGEVLNASGTTSTSSLLPSPYFGNPGDVYFVADTTHIWVWNGNEWIDNGQIQGPPGYTGSQGEQGPAGSSDAGALTGTTLASNVVSSSLTSVGALTGLSISDSITFSDNSVQTTAWNDQAFMDSMATYDGAIITNTATIGVGGLVVNGPVTFNGPFTYQTTATTAVTGNTGTFYGDVYGVGALYAGVAGYSPLPSTVIQSAANVNAYIQNNFQNINNGVQASTEWVATANNGDDSNHYLDMGIAGGGWDGSQSNSVGTAASANDSWLYAQGSTSTSAGGNLILGTIKNGKSVKILTGSTGSSSIVATFNGRNINATTTNSGSLQVVGGVGISQNLYAGTVYSNDNYYRGTAGVASINLSAGIVILGGDVGVQGGNIKGPANYPTMVIGAGSGVGNNGVKFVSSATVAGTTNSTSTNTGAFIVAGGAGIAGNVNVGGNVTATKFIGDGSSLTNVTVNVAGNIVGTSTNVTLVAGNYSWTFDNTSILTLPAPNSGNEGAEIDFGKAASSSLTGTNVILDQYVDRFRFFESGGTNRGAYIDLSQAAAGVGTLLNNRVGAYVNSGTFVTMDNLKVQVTTSGNRGLSIATVSGTFAAYISGIYTAFVGATSGIGSTFTITTTPTTSLFGWNFTGAGDCITYTISDTTNNRCYRVTLMIGPSYTNNMITIERLI